MKKFLILICISVCVFVLLERENISLSFAARMHDMQYSLEDDMTIIHYNQSVFLTQNRQYSEAKSLLSLILNAPDLHNPADVYELYGDLVYETRGSTGDVVVFYNRSLEYQNSERVQKKLSLLSTMSGSRQEQSGTETSTLNPPEDLTGSLLREARRQELSGDTKQRMRDLSAGMIEPQDLITRTLDIFDTGSSLPKDW